MLTIPLTPLIRTAHQRGLFFCELANDLIRKVKKRSVAPPMRYNALITYFHKDRREPWCR